jgi:hypothetical protein
MWRSRSRTPIGSSTPKLASNDAKTVTLRDWILAEAADDERRLRTVVDKSVGAKR